MHFRERDRHSTHGKIILFFLIIVIDGTVWLKPYSAYETHDYLAKTDSGPATEGPGDRDRGAGGGPDSEAIDEFIARRKVERPAATVRGFRRTPEGRN